MKTMVLRGTLLGFGEITAKVALDNTDAVLAINEHTPPTPEAQKTYDYRILTKGGHVIELTEALALGITEDFADLP